MSTVLCEKFSRTAENIDISNRAASIDHFISFFPKIKKVTANSLINKLDEHLNESDTIIDLCKLFHMSENFSKNLISLESVGDMVDIKIMGVIVTTFSHPGVAKLCRATNSEVALSLLTDILVPDLENQEQSIKSASILLENLEQKVARKLLSAGGKEYLKLIFRAQNTYELAQVDRIHNVIISLYDSQNIIGYTGKIDSNPTIYYHDKLHHTWGHITISHDLQENIGREIPIRDPNFQAWNSTGPDGKIRYNEVSPKYRYRHSSRSEFIPLDFMSYNSVDFKSLEKDALKYFMIKPFYRNMYSMNIYQLAQIACGS